MKPCESVIIYIWKLFVEERKAPFLAGAREPKLSGLVDQTLLLENLNWLPKMQVAGRSPKDLGELVVDFKWKKVQERIQWILELWLKNPLPLKVLNEVVTPFQMLEEQSNGWRVVTLPLGFKSDEEVVPGKPPLEFVLHDLEHAERFFHTENNYYGQVGFYSHLQKSVQSGFWRNLLTHSDFQKSFYYLMSDMNTHCVHMLKYLRANLWNSFQEDAEVIWISLVNELIQGQELRTIFYSINTKQEHAEDLVRIENYFVECGRKISPQEFFNESTRVVPDFFLSRQNQESGPVKGYR